MDPAPRDIDALKEAKKALRARMLAAREALNITAREAMSGAIQARLLSLPPYRSAGVVAAYCSFGSEFDTHPLLHEILQAGKTLLLPRIDRSLRALVFHEVRDLTQLLPGPWGIREPDPVRCPAGELNRVEFMLVPGLAFTPQGARLGYGGGYYDRVLGQLPPDTPKISAAFSLQVVESLPFGPGDRTVDGVLTESQAFGRASQA